MLSSSDLRNVLHLVASVGDPRTSNVIERRRKLASGLAALINADVYIWVIGVGNPDDPTISIPTASLDGGWRGDDERLKVLQMSASCPEVLMLFTRLGEKVHTQQPATFLRTDLVSDDEWQTVGKPIREIGLGDVLFSIRPTGDMGHSTIGLHRRLTSPPFGEREKHIADLVFQSVPWIHLDGLQLDAGRIGVTLTARQRETLMLLFQGFTNKKIAARMNVQVNTVGEYMKEIFKRFGVKSRGELLAKFLTGVQPGQFAND